MSRNLDLTSLRSFVAVADTGGVTRAAGYLNLTQSAVSMQLKRLEESLGVQLLERAGRGVGLSTAGEELLPNARRLLELNDEVLRRMVSPAGMRELFLGVPHDIVYPAIPEVLRQFNAAFPQVKVHLNSSLTEELKERFAAGEMDVILTTEKRCEAGGETLVHLPLVWVGAPSGQAVQRRPLRLAFEQRCIFRRNVQKELDKVGIDWEMAVDSNSFRTVSAMVSADLAVTVQLDGTLGTACEIIRNPDDLPDLGEVCVNAYQRPGSADQALEGLMSMLRHGFSSAVMPGS